MLLSMDYTKEIETPIGNHKVKFKTMLTGAEREQVEGAQMEYVDTEDGQTFKVKDMKKVANAQKHELLRVSVVSIDGDETDCLKRLQKMYDPDYQFVHQQILEAQKKASELTSLPSS